LLDDKFIALTVSNRLDSTYFSRSVNRRFVGPRWGETRISC